MAYKKVIKKIVSKDGEEHVLGSTKRGEITQDEMVCEEIYHRRDGETGIFKADKDEARYEVVYVHAVDDKMVEIIIIPQREMKKLVIGLEEKKKKNKPDNEAEVVMDKE